MIKDSEALHDRATAAMPICTEMVKVIKFDVDSLYDASLNVDKHKGPPKLPSRIFEKANEDYDDDSYRIADILRVSMHCNSPRTIYGDCDQMIKSASDTAKNGFEPAVAVKFMDRDMKVDELLNQVQ